MIEFSDYVLPMPSTLGVVVECWESAESRLRGLVQEKYDDLNEECITTLFHREFRVSLVGASEAGKIREAFEADLIRVLNEHLGYSTPIETAHLTALSEGIVADVRLHSHHEEGKTGGDFGFTVTRPQLSISPESIGHRVVFNVATKDKQFGLLTQAKLRRRNGKWGELTDKQKEHFPKTEKFLALLLYNYSDEGRCKLEPFRWKLCSGSKVPEAEEWLKLGSFGTVVTAVDLIRDLGEARIGTSIQSEIDEYIFAKDKPAQPHFEIIITWRGEKPGGDNHNKVIVDLQSDCNLSQQQFIN